MSNVRIRKFKTEHGTKKATRFQTARKQSGLSQDEVAEKLNTDRNTLSKWEHETAPIKSDRLKELSKLYGKSADYLLGLSDFSQIGNKEISEATGLSEKSIVTLRQWKEGSKIHETLGIPFDGLSASRLQMLNLILENERAIGLLDTLWYCIYYQFPTDQTNCITFKDKHGNEIGLKNSTLQNAFLTSVANCIDRLRNVR